MSNLTDTQLVILSAAANRDGGFALPLPMSLKIRGAAVTATLESLSKKGLLKKKPAGRNAASWREDKDGRRMMLVITDAGQRAIEGKPDGRTRKQTTAAKVSAKKSSSRVDRKSTVDSPTSEGAPPTVRQGTKQALLIGLLGRQGGATVAEAVEALGWQAHSVRGAISGTLKKKLGLGVTSERVDGRGRVYRITAEA